MAELYLMTNGSESSGSSVPFAVIGKKWKLSFVGRSRQVKAVVRDLESGFSPKPQLSGQVRPLTTPNWTTAPGHD